MCTSLRLSVSGLFIHRIFQLFPPGIAAQIVYEELHDLVQRLLQMIVARYMRRQKKILTSPERMIFRKRLGIRHVDGSAGQRSVSQYFDKGVLIDRSSTADT